MKTFHYKGFARSGRRTQGMIEAFSLKEARESLVGQDVFVKNIQEVDKTGKSPRMKRMKAFRKSFLYHELAAFVKAGIPLVEAVDMALKSPDLKQEQYCLAAVKDRLRAGHGFSLSMKESFPGLSDFEVGILRAGETSGCLERVLDDLGAFFDQQHAMREKLITSLTYPSLVAVLSFVIVTAMTGMLSTTYASLWEEMDVDLPILTTIVIGTAEVLWNWGIPIASVMAVLIMAWIFRKRRDDQLKRMIEKLITRIPYISSIYTALMSYRFALSLQILTASGINLVEAVDFAARATGSLRIVDDIMAKTAQLRAGGSAVNIIRGLPVLSESVSGWFEMGAASGRIPEMMAMAADKLKMSWELSIDRILRIIEPLMLVVVGAIVFILALAVLLPILTLNQSIM